MINRGAHHPSGTLNGKLRAWRFTAAPPLDGKTAKPSRQSIAGPSKSAVTHRAIGPYCGRRKHMA